MLWRSSCDPRTLAALALALGFCWWPPRRAAAAADAACTPGEAVLTFTTSTTKGKYAPKHVLAVWIADAKGGFVRTVLLNAKSKKKYLKRWVDETGRNYVDAVTSATLKAHGSVTARWDCRDAAGNVVPDGEYFLRVEFTEDHNQGPTTPRGHIGFSKGGKAVTREPKDLARLKGIKLVYSPASTRESRGGPPPKRAASPAGERTTPAAPD